MGGPKTLPYERVGVDFIYITHTNETKLSHYSIVHNLPLFYQQIFVSFNECKSFQTNVIATENFLSQPLWNNRFIMYKGKTLCFMDWIKSGLRYVKDVVDENGLKPPEWFLFHLVKKRNWLCEYNIMKSCLRRLCMKYEHTRYTFEKAALWIQKIINANYFIAFYETRNSIHPLINLSYQECSTYKGNHLGLPFMRRQLAISMIKKSLNLISNWCIIYCQTDIYSVNGSMILIETVLFAMVL